jgi:hypothetical protein
VANPPLKLLLFENPEATGTLNHVGVERESMPEVEAEANRLEAAGLTLEVEGDVVCCYARQDKHWVTGPDGQRWENYVVLADAHPELEGTTNADLTLTEAADASSPGGCCGTTGSASSSTGSSSEGEHVGAGAQGCCIRRTPRDQHSSYRDRTRT